MSVPVTIEALARALYETDPGTGGYPPLCATIPWTQRNDPTRFEHPSQHDRAAAMMKLIAGYSR